MSNPMDLLNQAKDAVQGGNLEGLTGQAREAIADRVDDIPIVGDQIAGLIHPGHGQESASTEDAAETPEPEAAPEDEEESEEEASAEEGDSEGESTEEA